MATLTDRKRQESRPIGSATKLTTRAVAAGAVGCRPDGSVAFVPMVTLGVDLASQAKKTAACRIRWDGGSAHVECLKIGLKDPALIDLFGHPDTGPDKIGIDAPFGWPGDFVRAIHKHRNSMHWPSVDCVDVSRLRLRRTDRAVKDIVNLTPLSVSADKIAMTAMRVARLLAKVHDDGEDVDRSGKTGRFVEVYPAVALKRWGLPFKSYRGEGHGKGDMRDKLVCDLAKETGLTLTDEVRSGCRESDDKLDALVAALVTRAAATGCCEPIADEDREHAGKEGWIALPRSDSLARLATDSRQGRCWASGH